MAGCRKDSDNIDINTLNTITEPNTKTLVDRYVFASNFCKGKTVLDCACGHGYGGVILRALGAKEVVGFDIDKNALDGAEERYDGFVTFDYGDVTEEWDEEVKFDCIVSIETFEHIKREDVPKMLQNFKNACEPGGTIIITTPQRHTPEWVYPGGTHFYEYNVNEFLDELSAFFNNIELYYALEFRHPASPELNTVFTKNQDYAKQAAVMVVVIKNDN